MIQIATILRHNLLGKSLNHLAVFGINVLLVRLMGASLSGSYFNELYVLNFIVFVFSAGLDYAAIALISREPALGAAMHKLMTRVVMMFAAIIILWTSGTSYYGHSYFKQPAAALALFSLGNLLLIFFQGILSAQRRFNLQNYVLLATNLAFLLALIVIDAAVQVSLTFLQNTYALLFALQGGLMWWFSRLDEEIVAISSAWQKYLKQGVLIMLSSLVYFALLRVDNFFVEKYCDAVTLSNYVQCGKLGQYFLYFSSAISSTLIPFIAAESIGHSLKEWTTLMRPYILLLCVAAVGLAVSGPFVFPLLFGDGFSDMHRFMWILLPGFVCLGGLTLLNAMYLGKGNIRRIVIGDLSALLLLTVTDSFIVPHFGAIGAAWVSSILYCLLFIYLLAGFRKLFATANETKIL